ncbi:MAG: Transposase [Syntrophorhabdaceae bacterium PtaU1.Bin034]|nr:MAG: Transposase [Syntrophorhabdaceae bacterium PtaU1.Bin034]
MEKIPRGVFTKEFKEEAVKMVIDGGLSIPEAGRRLSLPKSTLARWVKQARKGCLPAVNTKRSPITEGEMEVARLKREIAELKMERDILKKPPRTLRRSRLKGTRS